MVKIPKACLQFSALTLGLYKYCHVQNPLASPCARTENQSPQEAKYARSVARLSPRLIWRAKWPTEIFIYAAGEMGF